MHIIIVSMIMIISSISPHRLLEEDVRVGALPLGVVVREQLTCRGWQDCAGDTMAGLIIASGTASHRACSCKVNAKHCTDGLW
jgi:hypothetical protein